MKDRKREGSTDLENAFESLSEGARMVALSLPLCPGGSIEQLAAVSELDPSEIPAALQELEANSLIEPATNASPDDPRYQFTDDNEEGALGVANWPEEKISLWKSLTELIKKDKNR